MTDPLARLRAIAASRVAAGLRRSLRPRPADEPVLDLAGNDYLGLTRDPRVTGAAARAASRWGAGSTGSRLVTGSTELHADLETALAGFLGRDAAIVCSSGYLANLAAVVALSGPGALVVSDRANHASIVDACRLSRSRVVVTGHNDVDAVARVLAERVEPVAVVVTDSVFSAVGDRSPVGELYEVVDSYDALLVVDEAHALGVVGTGGRGVAHDDGVAGAERLVRTATLSKSFGAQGGVVVGHPVVIDHLVDAARSFIFDTGLAPACAGAALAALRVLESEPWLPDRVRANAHAIADIGRAAGFEVPEPAAAVVPIRMGEPDRAVAAAEVCAEYGVRVGCFRPPTVPEGESCLRITARANLAEEDLNQLGTALKAVAAL